MYTDGVFAAEVLGQIYPYFNAAWLFVRIRRLREEGLRGAWQRKWAEGSGEREPVLFLSLIFCPLEFSIEKPTGRLKMKIE